MHLKVRILIRPCLTSRVLTNLGGCCVVLHQPAIIRLMTTKAQTLIEKIALCQLAAQAGRGILGFDPTAFIKMPDVASDAKKERERGS